MLGLSIERKRIQLLIMVVTVTMIATMFAYNGQQAYAADIVTPYSPTKDAVTTGELNIRRGPGTSYETAGIFTSGASIRVYALVENESGKWYKTTYGGQWAYVFASYVKFSDEAVVSETPYSPYESGTMKQSDTARRTPSASGAVAGDFVAGQTFTVYSKAESMGATWYKTTYGGQWAYIPTGSVTLKSEAVPTNETLYNPYEFGTMKYSEYARVSPAAGASYSTIFRGGTTFTVYSKVESDGIVWYKGTYGGQWVYLSKASVILKADVSGASQTYFNPYRKGVIKYAVYAGSQPVSSAAPIGIFGGGATISIYSMVDVCGTKWYKTTYGGQWAYIPVESVTLSSAANLTSEEFEAYMTAQGFPESYKSQLRALQKAHPTWTFNSHNTGVSWSQTFAQMKTMGSALVEPTVPDSWKSKESGALMPDGSYRQFDGRWNQASDQVISHYLDPRNFLNEKSIYQFMDQKWTDGSANTNNIWNIVVKNNCFMNSREYVMALYYAGQNSGVNPTALTAMVVLEQGWRGGSPLISGNYTGYEGYYNHFNIGAYHGDGMTSIQRGLWYAKGSGIGSTTFGRPWNTIEKSITGGAIFYGQQYLNKNQNTFYTKRFNVMNGASNLGTHQYSTAIQAAEGEGGILKMGYATDAEHLVFWIPVYSGMPESPVRLP